MIEFNNLEKACEELDFKIVKRNMYIEVITDNSREIMFLHMIEAWDINFWTIFNWLKAEDKALLLKAAIRDYEEHLNGN